MPERVIQSCTGHSSLDALRKYERVSEKQKEAISKIFTGISESYDKEVLQDSSKELKSEKPSTSAETAVSTSDSSGASAGGSVVYKDCVVNMYSSPSFLSPIMPQYPQYPSYPPNPRYYPLYHQ